MPNIKKTNPLFDYPVMPNRNPGPLQPYGTLPVQGVPSPFWYMPRQPGTPLMVRALRTAFQQAARPVQRRVARSRRPFDRYRGW